MDVGEQVYQSIKPQTLQSVKQTSLLTAASLHRGAASEAAYDKDRLFETDEERLFTVSKLFFSLNHPHLLVPDRRCIQGTELFR